MSGKPLAGDLVPLRIITFLRRGIYTMTGGAIVGEISDRPRSRRAQFGVGKALQPGRFAQRQWPKTIIDPEATVPMTILICIGHHSLLGLSGRTARLLAQLNSACTAAVSQSLGLVQEPALFFIVGEGMAGPGPFCG